MSQCTQTQVEVILRASITMDKQRKLIAAQQVIIEEQRRQIERLELPALLRKQV